MGFLYLFNDSFFLKLPEIRCRLFSTEQFSSCAPSVAGSAFRPLTNALSVRCRTSQFAQLFRSLSLLDGNQRLRQTLCQFFCRAMICISAANTVTRCPSVCRSVCLSRSWILSKQINMSSNFFHRRVATHSSFFAPNLLVILRRRPRHGGVESRRGRQKSRFSANIWLSVR